MLKDGETFLTVRAIPVASGRALRRLTPLFSLPAGPAILPCWLEPVHLGERQSSAQEGRLEAQGARGRALCPTSPRLAVKDTPCALQDSYHAPLLTGCSDPPELC